MHQQQKNQKQEVERFEEFDKQMKTPNDIQSLKFFSDEEIEVKTKNYSKLKKFKININPFLKQYCKSTTLSISSEEQKTPADEIFSQFKPLKTIGQGAHSVVKYVKHKDGQHYAAKILQRSNDEEIIQQAKEEYQLLKQIQHPNIIKAQYMIHNSNMDSFAILLEFFKGRPLKKKKNYTIQEIQTILKQLFETITYLHTGNIVHRDLSIRNVLYNPEKQEIKLIDFGSAKQQKSPSDVMCTPINSGYSAPEQTEGGVYHNKVDIWSVGHILYYLLTDYDIDKEDLYEIILNQKLNIECNSAELIDLLKQLLVIDENKRITAKQALKHEFFTKDF